MSHDRRVLTADCPVIKVAGLAVRTKMALKSVQISKQFSFFLSVEYFVVQSARTNLQKLHDMN